MTELTTDNGDDNRGGRMIRIATDYDADVIVAGGGPAGAAVARHLARRGISVVVLDRVNFPRDKVCGDFVGPAALVELGALGVRDMDGYLASNVARRAALYLDGKELISRLFPRLEGMPAYGRVVPRYILDNWIVSSARQAGARLMTGYPVVGFKIAGDGVMVEVAAPNGRLTLRSRLLIGADGSSSTVARVMRGSAPPRGDRIVAVRAYYENVGGADDQLDLYFTSEAFPGYYWLFPTGRGEANVGLGMALETIPAHDETPVALLNRLIEKDAALAARLKGARLRGKIVGWPLITYNHRLPIVTDRVMLIGDAAGLINPLNGEGIQYALLSARWAADTVAQCVRRGDFSAAALAPYAAKVERELRYDMALARLIVQMITNRGLNPVWLEALRIIAARARKDAAYAEIAGGILAGLAPARSALNLRVVGGTIDQAAMSLGIKAVLTAFSGPAAWAGFGVDTAQVGFQLAYDLALNPLGFTNWLMRVASDAVELGAQASWDAIGGRARGAAPVVRLTG